MKLLQQEGSKEIERQSRQERESLQTRPAKPYNKIFPWFFVSKPKIVYIVHPCVQFCSVGPLVPPD